MTKKTIGDRIESIFWISPIGWGVVFFILLMAIIVACGLYHDTKVAANPDKYDESTFDDISNSYKNRPDFLKSCKIYWLTDRNGTSHITVFDCPDHSAQTVHEGGKYPKDTVILTHK